MTMTGTTPSAGDVIPGAVLDTETTEIKKEYKAEKNRHFGLLRDAAEAGILNNSRADLSLAGICNGMESPPDKDGCNEKTGDVVLNYAVNSLECVQFLLKEGFSTRPNNNGQNVLYCAAQQGSVDVVKYLVHECNRPTQTVDLLGNNLFHAAAQNSNPKPVLHYLYTNIGQKTLVTRMANTQNKDGLTPIQCAAKAQNLAALQWFIDEKISNRLCY